MSVNILAGALVFIIFTIIGALHIYWAIGGRWGVKNVIPEKNGKPLFEAGKVITSILGVVFFCCGLMVAFSSGLILAPLPGWMVNWSAFGLAFALGARAIGDFHYVGFFKTTKGTGFSSWDTKLYSPLCAVLSVLTLLAIL